MTEPHVLLDNPVWHALSTHQELIALGDRLARRFLPDIAPFGAVAKPDEDSFDDLAKLVPPGESVALLGDHPALDDRWEILRQLSLVQMLYVGPPIAPVEGDLAVTSLSAPDVPAMFRLVDVTHPGPFLPRTIELGQYLAICQEGQLAAMAGERLHVPGYREISAVCTHPAYQRRGFARILVRHLMRESQRRGEIPFLHVFSENTSAIALYEMLGFAPRVNLSLTILQRR